MRRVSKYEVIWQRLKRDKYAMLVAPIPFHPRIIKAVIKRKDIDLVYKLESAERRVKVKLRYIRDASGRIRFYLHEFSSLHNIQIGEL